MRVGYKIKTLPTVEPVTLQEAKDHLKVDFEDEDSLITGMIAAARDYAETYCNRALMTQTILQVLHDFPFYSSNNPYCAVRLYRTPVQSLVSITYKDLDGNSTTVELEKVVLSNIEIPARIAPKSGENWPDSIKEPGAITIEYTAGVSDPADVAPSIKSAILLLVGEMYERRENFVKSLPDAVTALLSPYKIREF